MSRLYSVLRQIFPPPPRFTESDYPDLSGKVCIVTGANRGVGKEVARLLYSKNATVYAAGRSESKTMAAIEEIKTAHKDSTGSIKFLALDLGDLTTIKNSASAFLTNESRLDLLINNAGVMIPPGGVMIPPGGVMIPPAGSKTTQGYELQLGTNCVAPFLFTKLLTPTIVATARNSPQGSVRIVWASSSAADVASPHGGVPMDNLDYKRDQMRAMAKYGVSKAGNYYHSTEFARRYKSDGIVSVALNPGNLTADLDRQASNLIFVLGRKLTTYAPIYGAYTELFAALSPEISIENTGCWVVPWGRFGDIRSDLVQGSKPKSEGGSGIAQEFWEWSEGQVKQYL